MPDYLRPKVPGATVFYTVTLAARGGSALFDHVGALREAVRRTRAEWPFRGANGRSPGGEAGHVRTEEEFAAAVRYCHINPVKHGLVAKPQDWPWSSVHREIAAGRWTWP